MAYGVVIGTIYLVFIGALAANLWYLRRERLPSKNLSGKDNTLPSLSVLVPARNEASNLKRLLPSIIRQKYPDFELIVYDDQSTDSTAQVVQKIAREAKEAPVTLIVGKELPTGWTGKSYALYSISQQARGELFLFLDADACLNHRGALQQLVRRWQENQKPASCVMTGFTRLRGSGQLLTSLVPFTILVFLPWPLVAHTRSAMLSALNGQCWMIAAKLYQRLEPHRQVRGEVLEDVEIGRYLKAQGVLPYMVDVQEEVSVFMYDSFQEAWRGFQKNAYLLLGGTPLKAVGAIGGFAALFIAAPLVWPWVLLLGYGLKLITDRRSGFPFWVTLCAPLSFLLGIMLQVDSMRVHLQNRVRWKGRLVKTSED